MMKKVLVTAREDDIRNIRELLEDSIHFIRREGKLAYVTIYLHEKELDPFLTDLQKAIDLRYKENIIEVSSPDFVISSVLQRSEQKTGAEEERTPVEKLVDSTRPHLTLDLSRVALTSIAGMIALTGLFMDNIPVIIGAMLLSPLLGPIYAFSVNVALGKARDVLKTIGNLTALLIMVIAVSCIATVLISQVTDLSLTIEIRSRMDSNFIYILMAILLGFATMCALSRDISESIAGVAIAAALLPPAVVAGISLVLYPEESLQPLVLTLENVLGLMAGSLAATPILHIRPRRTHEKTAARRLVFRTASVLAVLLLLLVLISVLLA